MIDQGGSHATLPPLDETPIRRFADSNLQSSIDKALANLSPNAKGAVVAHADLNGFWVDTVVGKVGPGWSVVASVGKPWKGKFEAEAAVRFQW